MMLLWILAVGVLFLLLERLWPNQTLSNSKGWWLRAIGFNAAQLGVVMLGGKMWDEQLQRVSLLSVATWTPNTLVQGLIGYLVATFVYYWWHRARHDSQRLWLGLHQLHHSPTRLEVITSFYKHPSELICNSILSGLISYTLLGLSIEGAGWMMMFSAIGEFFYHMNVATPRWLGWFIQRPEMHRIHHERGVHKSNYADLPLWDMLFGTYDNPETYQGPCGFDGERETRVVDMLLGRDVNEEPS